MDLWFNAYRKRGDDRSSPLVLDLTNLVESVNPSTPFEESQLAIQKIVEEHEGPYTLMCSGGIDSQAMICAWIKSKHPFTVVHYSYGSNMEDTKSLLAFCSSNLVPLKIKHFNVNAFLLSDEYKEMAIRYDTASPHLLTYAKFISLHKETCISAGNFFQEYSTALNWTQLGLDRFRKISKPNYVPMFFQSTPNLAYSFLPILEHLNTNREHFLKEAVGPNFSYCMKVLAYQMSGFDVIAQDKKLTGFEGIKESYDNVKIDRRLKMKWSHMPSKRVFDVLFRYELFDILPFGFYSEDVEVMHNDFINTL